MPIKNQESALRASLGSWLSGTVHILAKTLPFGPTKTITPEQVRHFGLLASTSRYLRHPRARPEHLTTINISK
jgi:hypothetical protein